jgi:hypothetical protein
VALDEYRDLHHNQQMGASPQQWRKGDILLEQNGRPPGNGGDRRSNEADRRLRDFIDASDTGESYHQAFEYRAVAAAFSVSARSLNVPWTVYRLIHARDDRNEFMRDFMRECEQEDAGRAPTTQAPTGVRYSTRRMERKLGRRGTPLISRDDRVPEVARGLRDMSAAERAAVVSEVVATDQGLADAIVHDHSARVMLLGAERRLDVEIERENAERREQRTRADPSLRRLDQAQAHLDLQREVDRIRESAARISNDYLPRLGREAQADPLGLQMLLRSALEDLDASLEPIRHFVATGSTDLDEFLGQVLGTN